MRVCLALVWIAICGGCAPAALKQAAPEPPLRRWVLDSLTRIGDAPFTVLGTPSVKSTELGPALCFDGDDGVLVEQSLLAGLGEFTLEVAFMPAVNPAPEHSEPRFVHIEGDDGMRATVEARVNGASFYLDTHLRSNEQKLTLAVPEELHAAGEWHWAALVYANGEMRHYVDGREEARGAVKLGVFGAGKTSLGVRQNRVHWFEGCLREVRVTPMALDATRLQGPRASSASAWRAPARAAEGEHAGRAMTPGNGGNYLAYLTVQP